MKRILALGALFASLALSAQSINPEMLQRIQGSFQRDDAATRAVQNILTANADIRSNALNHAKAAATDHLFKYRTDVSGITDQERSGRCWLFTSTNQIRPLVMKK